AQWYWSAGEMPTVISDARSAPLVRQGANWLLAMVPENARHETGTAADTARDRVRDVQDAQQAMDRLLRPPPDPLAVQSGKPADEQPPAYNDSQIRDMQRLIDSTQPGEPRR